VDPLTHNLLNCVTMVGYKKISRMFISYHFLLETLGPKGMSPETLLGCLFFSLLIFCPVIGFVTLLLKARHEELIV
jgi:hypothetical protein